MISSFIPFQSKKILGMISVFLSFQDSFCGLTYDLSWRMFHVCLKRMCSLLLLGRMFCTCLLGLSGLKYSLSLLFPYCFCSGWSIHWWKWGIEVPYYYCIVVYTPFRSVTICLKYLGALMLGAGILKIVVSFLWIDPLWTYNDLLCLLLQFLT